jgi:hypothetical protein
VTYTKSFRQFTIGRAAVGANALGALAIGAFALGALAIGSLAVGRLAVGKASLQSVSIDDLKVARLHVVELVVTDSLTTPAPHPLGFGSSRAEPGAGKSSSTASAESTGSFCTGKARPDGATMTSWIAANAAWVRLRTL